MPSWVEGVGTFALSLVLAYGLLWLRCRGAGHPFGPRARAWALLIVVATALVSTGVGLLIFAASHHGPAAFAGLIVPGGLWLSRWPPHHDARPAPRLALPFGHLYDRMGDDMQDWCDTRVKAAAAKPQWIADAVKYYYDQVDGGLKDSKARADLSRWRDSITHKIGIVRLIGLDPDQDQLRASLQMHPATQHIGRYRDEDLPRLARRLETEALNELHLFLGYVYRLGYHKLLIYPFRPFVNVAPEPTARSEPTARRADSTGPAVK